MTTPLSPNPVHCFETVDVRAHTILRTVQFQYPSAVIAGGYLRDQDFGIEPKDLDIIVPADATYGTVYDALAGFDIDAVTVDSTAQDVNFTWEVSFSVPRFAQPINMIGAKHGQTPIEKVLENDFGICQIYYDGMNIHRTDAYRLDAGQRHFTLCRCRSRQEWEAVYEHYLRLYNKYPWPMVVDNHYLRLIQAGY